MSHSSRYLARTWPYPHHRRFEAKVRAAAASWFRSKGYAVHQKYSYILTDWGAWPDNIILPETAAYVQTVAGNQRRDGHNFPLHKYIHHGLSSQAMLFNLVGPMLLRGDLNPLRRILERQGVEWPDSGMRAIFEYEDRAVFNEDSGQPTSIDLAILDEGGDPRIFIEAKFVEKKFGGCSIFAGGDCDGRNPAMNPERCYLHHTGRTYWSLMKELGLDQGAIGEDAQCIFTNHYQFFRELLFALQHGGTFVLLCDQRSPIFYCEGPQGERGLMPYLLELLPEQLRRSVASVTVQELVAEIAVAGGHEWVNEFKVKYGLD
jgi:hypothetical protein